MRLLWPLVERENMKILMILGLLLLAGCTTYTARVGDAEVQMTYFLQDKSFKSFGYNSETKTITIEEYGSETSQIIEAVLKGVK